MYASKGKKREYPFRQFSTTSLTVPYLTFTPTHCVVGHGQNPETEKFALKTSIYIYIYTIYIAYREKVLWLPRNTINLSHLNELNRAELNYGV